MLQSFHGKNEIKEKTLNDTALWLRLLIRPKTAEERVNELFDPIRTFESSDCALEDFSEFPEQLGLPDWLGNLLSTIYRHNTSNEGVYRHFYYPAFLKACNVGIDYTLMYHQWEIVLLTVVLPGQERKKKYILDLIKLHKSALKNIFDVDDWLKLKSQIHAILESTREVDDVIYHSARVAYLSIENFTNQIDPWTTSSEALVDALVAEQLNATPTQDHQIENKLREKEWILLMSRLRKMLNKWN